MCLPFVARESATSETVGRKTQMSPGLGVGPLETESQLPVSMCVPPPHDSYFRRGPVNLPIRYSGGLGGGHLALGAFS